MPNALLVHEDLKAGDFCTMKEKEINGVLFTGLCKLTVEELVQMKKDTINQELARSHFIDLVDLAIEKEQKGKIIKI